MAEPAFVGAGQAPGLEIWRIENFSPVKMPKVMFAKTTPRFLDTKRVNVETSREFVVVLFRSMGSFMKETATSC